MSADLIAGFATLAFVGLLVGTSLLGGRGLGLEQRAGLLERRDPGTAEALRRAQSITDLSSWSVFGDEGYHSAVCTPSRVSWMDMARVRASGSDVRVEPPEEALPPMPATVLALVEGSHLAPRSRTRHPSPSPDPRRVPSEAAEHDGAAHEVGAANSAGHHATASG
ncbi:hypothetical protein BJ978_003085 [Agromyces terreus]|uniref:Uncharacterized protein n=1 Tax=Agromyces terreus TaxID=424795 RepID=A0A9X2H9D4_9MICO|nr:hypothetical protein [Agromyces terreus]MCP2372409.1 hypothetical protein [Agromyces terreus]